MSDDDVPTKTVGYLFPPITGAVSGTLWLGESPYRRASRPVRIWRAIRRRWYAIRWNVVRGVAWLLRVDVEEW